MDLRAEVRDRPDCDALVATIADDYRDADLSAADRAMLDYAVALTESPQARTRADLDRLREVGFEDRDIAQIVQITAMFNYYNRIADGLGIADEPEWDVSRG